MATRRCDECGTRVRIAGGIGDMWSGGGPSGGMALTFDDGSERFLCFDCIERLDEADIDGAGGEGEP